MSIATAIAGLSTLKSLGLSGIRGVLKLMLTRERDWSKWSNCNIGCDGGPLDDDVAECRGYEGHKHGVI
jgi:hypothetical protein